MFVKLKHRLHRARETVRRPFRRNKREKLDFHDFHVDWDGPESFSEVLEKSLHASGPLKSTINELWRCFEMFESNQHKTTTRSCEDYEKLGIEMNDLFRVLSKLFDGPSTASITHESVAKLARDIGNETKILQSEQQAAGQDVGIGKDVQGALRCCRRVLTLLGRFALNENTDIWKIPDESLLAARLDSLLHSPAAQYRYEESGGVRRTGCMPDTRIKMLQQLRDWVNYNDGQTIYWLNGLAGTGKTAIAYSFCEQLESAGKLAASFFCSRQLPECRDVTRILPTISYQLSSISRPFRYAVSSALEDPEVHGLPIAEQLAELVAGPLRKVKHTFPANMVIVVDALDECEDNEGVDRILDILLRSTSDLPVKFFITSRPCPIMLTRMRSKRDEHVVFELRLHEANLSAVDQDIRIFLTTKLRPVNLSEQDIATLVRRSGSFFSFAATIANYVGHDSFSQGTEPLNHILAAPIPSANESNWVIDLLYTSTLQVAFDNSALGLSEQDELVLVLHVIAYAQEPLTVDVLAGLLKFAGASSVDNALLLLQPLLQVSETSGLVTTIQNSFKDYLLDRQRSDRFYCNSKKHHARLAQACFHPIVVSEATFNVCKLESSYLRDQEVPNMDQRVKEAISPELLYACRFWGTHVKLAGQSEELVNRLHEFLATRLLLWMEILNFNRCMRDGIGQLGRLRAWLKEIKGATIVQDLADDAWRFARAFSSSPMADSTPHIYISMLPFWPERRPVSKHYMPHMLAFVKATGEGMRKRERAALAVLSSDSKVECVAFSSNNTCIISGSWDGTICVWDAHTGQPVGRPLEGHTRSVRSVAYSPNGAYIVSASYDKTIRIWNAHTKQPVRQPLKGHTGSVNSVAYSPNGAYIVSASSDNTIRIWDAHTGRPVDQPLKGHTDSVNSVAYSPNGACLVSASSDHTIRIWDAHTRRPAGQPLEGHTDTVDTVAYSPNGAYIVSASWDNTIRIWNAHTGQPVGQPLEGHTDSVRSVAYSPNGAHIASASWDNTIRIWNAHTGQPVGQPLKGHTDSARAVAYSPNGAYIVSGSWDKTTRIWDAHTGQRVGRPLEGHTASVNSVAYSPSGAHIVSASSDKTIRIWDARTGHSVGQPLEDHTASVCSVAYSPSGAYIVSASSDNTIRIWDAHTGQPVGQSLKGHTHFVRSVAYSPNGAYIVSASSDNTIRIWNAHTEQPVGQPLKGHTGSANAVAYSPNGAYIVSASYDKTIRIWDAHTGQPVGPPLKGHRGSVRSVAYSSNGAYIVSGSWDKTIRIWNAHTGQPVGRPLPLRDYTCSVNSVAYSPNGAYIVSASSDNTIHIWDAHTGQPVGRPLKGHTRSVNSVAYSPNGAYIVSASSDNTIHIWNAHTGQPVGQPLEGHTGSVNSAAYSPNGAYIVSASSDNTIRIWDADTGRPVGLPLPLKNHVDSVNSVAYSPNGAYIVSASSDHTIRIWDAHTGRPVDQPLESHTSWVNSVAYSPNGAYIVSASSDHAIRIWDAHTGRPVGQPLEGHTSWVNSVAYSPNGAYIVSASSDNTIRIWNAHTGRPVDQPLKGHTDAVNSVAYSPNGAYIVSASSDNTIRIWNAHTGQPVGLPLPLKDHIDSVNSVAYSPSGAYIVSASSDHTIRIWDAHTGRLAGQPLEGHTDSVYSVAYSPNGAHIVSASLDETIRIWDARQTGMIVSPAEASLVHSAPSESEHPLSYPAQSVPLISDTVTGQLTERKLNEVDKEFDDWTLDEQGWVVNAKQDRLVWVPYELRDTLLRPQNTAVISRSGSVRLDFRNAKLGEEWGRCFDSQLAQGVN